ncbi:MAG: response regulator [Treponema sp.]|jgi:CheY-like chemotaxis protein|nr:response regulator [Treponema sp.]
MSKGTGEGESLFSLETVIEEAVESFALDAHRKGLELVMDIPSSAAPLTYGDPQEIRRGIAALVSGALTLTDQGAVIAAAVREGDSVTVSVRSAPNPPIDRLTIPLRAAGAAPGSGIYRPDARILLVDDGEEARRVIHSRLEDAGCVSVDTAASGEAALARMREAAAQARPYECCLIDMVMPRMDGWRLAAAIQAERQAALVLMVPCGLAGVDERMARLGWFAARIDKPVKRGQLIAALNALFTPADDPLDLRTLQAAFMGNTEMIRSLISRFIERTDEQMAGFGGLIAREDWEQGWREAHLIKGSALTLGGNELGRCAARLERAFAPGSGEDREAALSALRDAYTRFQAAAVRIMEAR